MTSIDHTAALELFAPSRNPLEFLDREPARRAPSWFVVEGLDATRRFVGAARRHRQTRGASFAVSTRRVTDALGRAYNCSAVLTLELGATPPISAGGWGQAGTASGARVIALAESIERLAYALQCHLRTGDAPRRPTSNGACFHSSPLEVVKGAIGELLERDAFLVSWYSGRALPTTIIDEGHPLFAGKQAFARIGWELREHHWRHDRAPADCVMVSLARRRLAPDQWNFFLGGGAAPSYRDAIARAYQEALRLFRTWRAAFRVDTSARATASRLTTPTARMLLYQKPSYVRRFLGRLAEPRAAVGLDAAPLDDRSFVAACRRALTTLDILPLPVPRGLHDRVFCIQAICPELQDLDFRTPPLVNPRRIAPASRRRPSLPHPIC